MFVLDCSPWFPPTLCLLPTTSSIDALNRIELPATSVYTLDALLLMPWMTCKVEIGSGYNFRRSRIRNTKFLSSCRSPGSSIHGINRPLLWKAVPPRRTISRTPIQDDAVELGFERTSCNYWLRYASPYLRVGLKLTSL